MAEVRTDLAGSVWDEAAAAFREGTGWELIRQSAVASGGRTGQVKRGAMTMHDALTWIELAADIPMVGQPSVFLADKTVAVRIPGAIPEAVQEAFGVQTGGWILRVR